MAKAITKGIEIAHLQGQDKLIGELFTGNIIESRLRAEFADFITNTLEQMRFSQSTAAMDKERIKQGTGLGNDSPGSIEGRRDGCVQVASA